jgi:hypothetical protein
MSSKKITGYLVGLSIIAMGIASYFFKFLDSPAKEALLILFSIYGVWRLYRAYNLEEN